MSQRRGAGKAIDAAIEVTKKLDAFPKIAEDYTETSSTRGTFSIFIFASIFILVCLEIRYFYQERLEYSYEVDFDYLSKLKLNIDVTVASKCEAIGADVLDTTSNLLSHQPLNMTDTWFELSVQQQMHFDSVAQINHHIRENYHALHSGLWFKNINAVLPERENFPNYPMDSCRIHGSLNLNKVLGLLHILAGKPINIMGQHGHALKLMQEGATNFSHRIDQFSFGDNTELVHSALNYELKVNHDKSTMYQYFISVVATEVGDKKTFQYSVTERESQVSHEMGVHGQPGIYFKYDISPVKVKVALEKKRYLDLLIPLIGLIGGIFATSTMLNSFYQSAKEYIENR